MKVLGIISEYNPFHYGHRYHISQSKKENSCDYTVVVMSGAMVQRGEFAILEQHRRAKTAIENGADLVLEMPVCYCSQSAEIFAFGGVNILDRLGFVDTVCCGCESNSLEDINTLVPIICQEENDYVELLKINLNKGLSFPKARNQTLLELTGISLSNKSNDILSLEYAKALFKLKSNIKLSTVLREGQAYNSKAIDKGYASATGIREAFFKGTLSYNLAPHNTISDLCSYGKLIDTFTILQSIVFRENFSIKNIFDVNEGLENSIISNISKASSKEQLIGILKSKRYTHTRLSRILNNILLGLDKASMKVVINSFEKPYSKILALNDKGRYLLSKVDKAKISLINKPASFSPENQLQQVLFRYDNVANSMFLSLSKEVYVSQNQISPIVLP